MCIAHATSSVSARDQSRPGSPSLSFKRTFHVYEIIMRIKLSGEPGDETSTQLPHPIYVPEVGHGTEYLVNTAAEIIIVMPAFVCTAGTVCESCAVECKYTKYPIFSKQVTY